MGSMPTSRMQRRTVAGIAFVSLLGMLYVILTSQQLTVQFPRSMYTNQQTANLWNYDFRWTIFITPQDFEGLPDKIQRRAIQSWQRLHPKPEIVLVGQGKGYDRVAQELGVTIYPHLDMNFAMLPLAGSLIDTAMNWPTDVSVIVNSDIILTQSLPDAIAKLQPQFPDFFITGARHDVNDLPVVYEPSRSDFNEAGFVGYVKTKGTLHTAGGLDYFVWSNTGKQLFHGAMPPFIRGKSKFDNWFVHEVIQAGYRDVIDTTEAVVAVHVAHDYQTASGKVKANAGEGTFWMKEKRSNWMIFHNAHLAAMYGSYQNQDGTTVHAPWKLASCLEDGGMCLMKRLRPGICPCEHNAFALSTQNDPQIVEVFEHDRKKNLVRCGGVSIDPPGAWDIQVQSKAGHDPVFGLPFTLKDLLPVVSRDNHVLLTGASFAYRDVVMNFVCNLRRLGLYDQLIIAAFDEDMYRYGFRMGLPIFFYQSPDVAGLTSHDLEYGSQHFRKVTKLKSQVVLQILRLGYDVTWTDTDIYWFRNPLPLLGSMSSDFVVQSNAPYPEEQVANGPLRINSGFYRVRSTPLTIVAMEQIVAHAASSRLTEQPSFYIILCGGKGGETAVGDDRCTYRPPTNMGLGDDSSAMGSLDVQFLDREVYANGAVGGYWDQSNLGKTQPQLVLLHNNWIKGLRAKIERFFLHKMWVYDRAQEVCFYGPTPEFVFDWSLDDVNL
eukprot:m.130774 g.130774  ORF g.130774 m.130774 type:complete len:716 (+) comp15888_c0_seq4:182-2329(+)